MHWARATEELFFAPGGPFGVASMTSSLRPDLRATRRNAYYRLFGLDLNHGLANNAPYPFVKPAMANRQFVPVFEEFLREVWRGIENSYNSSGPNAADPAAVRNLEQSLRDMLVSRRGSRAGVLSREEFLAVSTMSWFELSISSNDSPVVAHLRASAASTEERLRQIGDRVGLPAHSRTYDYLRLAPVASRVLLGIEDALFKDLPDLYFRSPATGQQNSLRDDLQTIITHWSMATGRDMKAGKVTMTDRAALPAPARFPVTLMRQAPVSVG
jgi:hypothetical protein